MKKRVMILGCGPAGLFAAHAARQLGYAVDIFSKKRRSEMFGAQYLHTNIPGLTDDQHPFTVEYRLNGALDDYLHKVYGEVIPDPGKITVESLVGEYEAWDIRRAYLKAWELYASDISHVTQIHPGWLRPMLGRPSPWAAVVSTIPAKDICIFNASHSFDSRFIWAMGDAPERGQFVPSGLARHAPASIIQYDGTEGRPWYRVSNIAGYSAVEWPYRIAKPFEGVSLVTKPVMTNCVCWTELEETKGIRFIRTGRYGTWHRSGHTHQAYWRILDALKDLT